MKFSKGFKYTFLAAFFWAISIVSTRFVMLQGENPYNVIFWTTILGSPYWIYILKKNKKEARSLSKKNISILLGMGLISTIGTSICKALALQYSPALNYSLLIRSVILFTFIFAYIFLGENITKKKIIIASVILLGAFLLTTNGQMIQFTLGDIFTLSEAALIALGNTVLGKMATNEMTTDLSASASFLIGVLPIALIAYLNGAIGIPISPILIIFLSLLYILITIFRFKAYKQASASYVTMVFSFTPVLVSFMAVPFLSESLSTIQILGGILIIIASISVEKLKI